MSAKAPDVAEKVEKQLKKCKNIWRQSVENSNTTRLKQIEKRMERLEKKMDKLLTTFEKHIKFIDNTYAGLQKPIASIKKFLKG
jgi:uncharacterized coiled-coil DUF342 family protein